MRTCKVCKKSSPTTSFLDQGCGLNELCDRCWKNGKVGKYITGLLEQCESDKRRAAIKEMMVKKLQTELEKAKSNITANEKNIAQLTTDRLEQSFREQTFQSNESQISLLNELVNTSRILSSEMEVKFKHDQTILQEVRDLKTMIVESREKKDSSREASFNVERQMELIKNLNFDSSDNTFELRESFEESSSGMGLPDIKSDGDNENAVTIINPE